MQTLEPHAIAVMALTLIALYLFSRETIRIETSSLLIVALLAVGFMVFPYRGSSGEFDPLQFFSGFSNEALIAICALMMASQGLIATGALTPVGRVVSRLWAWSPLVAMGAVLVLTAFLSAFMNNTPQVVLMIPLLTAVAARSGMSPSKVLMPMTFASQIGGMGTPIGTSLNLLVIASAASLGVERFHMFDFAAPAALASIAGIAYLWFIAPRLLPERQPLFEGRSTRVFEAQLHIAEESAAAGLSLTDANKLADGRMTVQGVRRAGGSPVAPLPDLVLRPGDRVIVRDKPERLMEFAQLLGAKLYAGDEPVDEEHPLTAENQQTAELVLTATSPLRGRSLAQSNFDWRYQVVPLAIHRPGIAQALGQSTELRDVTLGVGDVLLVQGPAEQIQSLKQRNDLLVLDATTDVPQTSKAPIAMAIMAGIILAASFRILPIAIAAVCGVLLMVVTGCLRWRDAMRALDSSMILLTVASLALSLALVTTGGATFIAKLLATVSGSLPPVAMMSATILVMALLANIISNSAAAVIGTPIAVELARQLGVAPEPFVLAVLFGVNMSYATPMADNCNLLIYSAGGYAFKDFIRAGVPLLIIMWLAFSWLLPQFFPLQAG